MTAAQGRSLQSSNGVYKKDHTTSVLIMCLADPGCNPRPRRAIELCRSMGFEVSVMGYSTSIEMNGVLFYNIPTPSNKIFSKIMRKLYSIGVTFSPFEQEKVFLEKMKYGLSEEKEKFQENFFDLIIVEDLQLLPLAYEIKGRGKVLFDAREYYPRQNEGNLWFDLFEKSRRVQLCRDYLPRCDGVLTVSNGLRNEYLKEFGVVSEVYRSTPNYFNFPVRSTNSGGIHMVYHGLANRNRRLENLISVFTLLDERFHLDLILVGNEKYQNELKHQAAKYQKINFPRPLPFDKIVPTLCQYDIGLFYCEPTTFNLENCLPNKFFEFIQARLMIAIGPSPAMAELVEYYKCGIVAESFSVESMAKALNSLSAESIDAAKSFSDLAAKELCFENESKKMHALLESLLQ